MRSLFISLLLMCGVSVFAQQTITGTVTDEDTKEGMPQVSVKVKGTAVGAVTDLDGKFSLAVPEGSTVLVFTYIGYSEQEVDISTVSGDVNVSMESADIGLNQVVVSASKKEEKIIDAPASVTTINAEKIETQASTSVIDNLRSIPSVDILKQGLLSSNVTIRGFNNIFSGAMLTIIDNRIAKVPSLRLNAYQLIPTNTHDIERMEVVRGPGSALYGPDAADGVLAIFTKSPLDNKQKVEGVVSLTTGLRGSSGADPRYNAADSSTYRYYKGEDTTAVGRGFISPDIWLGVKLSEKVGFKISANYFGGNDWRYYDPEEPAVGDTLIFGTVQDGRVFEVDSSKEPEPFDRDLQLRKYSADGRFDFRFNKNLTLILSGGFSTASGVELTGLGAAQVKEWTYSYAQARLTWKKLFFQYFLNNSNSGGTYLIPRVSGAAGPHTVQSLVDKSKVHVWQIQHSYDPIEKLKFIYGVDAIFTNPRTEGTIHGRFEEEDNIIQTGGYIQGEWDIIKKLALVTAFRVDWQNDVGTQFSPRAALVYKATPRHTLRATYNRAFSSPTALNQSLDLSNGVIPNGINIRGIGNRNGYNYVFDDAGNPKFLSPYTSQWYSVGDRTDNHLFFDGMMDIIAAGLASSSSFSPAIVSTIVTALTEGISGSTGTIQNVAQVPIDYVNLVNSGDFQGSVFTSLAGFNTLKPIDNQVTQTLEIGYKGILGDKVFATADFYVTRISDYVSPLTLATASVMLNPAEVIGALGTPGPGGLLYDNLQGSFIGTLTYDAALAPLLDGNPDYTDPTGTIPSLPGTTWDELAYIMSAASTRIPVGSVTPNDENVQSDVILTYINLGTLEVGGMDLSVNYMINDKWTVSAAYSYMTKDKIPLAGAQGGYVALNSPKHKTSVSIENKCKKIGLTSRLSYRWMAEFPGNSAVYVGTVQARHLLDASICYDLWFSKKTSICVDVQNILNKKYNSFPGTPYMGILGMVKIAQKF